MARCNCASGSRCDCAIIGGPGITVSGTGTAERPYLVSAAPNANGAILFEDSSTVDFTVTGSGTQIDPYIVRATAQSGYKYVTNIGNGSSLEYAVNHNLGTRDVHVTIYENGNGYSEPDVEVRHTSTNTVTVVFNTAPTVGQYRIFVSV